MLDRADHCPFLNRTDARCSANFSLDHMGYAFRFCFDKYEKCPLYAERLSERRVKQVSLAHAGSESTQLTLNRTMRLADVRTPFVQVTIPGKAARPAAHQPA